MAGYDDIQSGSLVQYQFLWHREAQSGEMEGRKKRPCAVVIRAYFSNADRLMLLPVTTKEPMVGVLSIEIPETEKMRIGLDTSLRSWIVLDEVNADEIPSYVLEPDAHMGNFSKAFFHTVLRVWKNNYKRLRITNRAD